MQILWSICIQVWKDSKCWRADFVLVQSLCWSRKIHNTSLHDKEMGWIINRKLQASFGIIGHQEDKENVQWVKNNRKKSKVTNRKLILKQI